MSRNITPQEQQQMIQKLLQQKSEAAGDMLEKALNTEIFPNEMLTPLWRRGVSNAIFSTQPFSQRISLQSFADVVAINPEKEQNITLFQFGVLTNSLDTVSREQLEMEREDYVQMVKETTAAIEFYKDRMKQIQDDIQQKVEEQFLDRDNMVKSGRSIMQPVKAEA